MALFIQSKRRKLSNIESEYDSPQIIDVTSKAPEPWVRFSPFYPVGDIPVPFSDGHTSQSVEGIWQGLKVFEEKDVDEAAFYITSMKGIKRTVRKNGRCLGHRQGIGGEQLLGYVEARKRIYLPSYRVVLERNQALVSQLDQMQREGHVVLLDYETNGDIENTRKPLSHAWLMRYWICGVYDELCQA